MFKKAFTLICGVILSSLSASVGLAATQQDYLDSAKLWLDGSTGTNGQLTGAISAANRVFAQPYPRTSGTGLWVNGRGQITPVRSMAEVGANLLAQGQTAAAQVYLNAALLVFQGCARACDPLYDASPAKLGGSTDQVSYALPELVPAFQILDRLGVLTGNARANAIVMLQTCANFRYGTGEIPSTGNLGLRYGLGIALVANLLEAEGANNPVSADTLAAWRNCATTCFRDSMQYRWDPVTNSPTGTLTQITFTNGIPARVPVVVANPQPGVGMPENASGYVCSTVLCFLQLADALPRSYLPELGLQDTWSQIRQLLDNYRMQMMPLGVIPSYGDSNWVAVGPWVSVFEKAAQIYKDTTVWGDTAAIFRDTADRMFNYNKYLGNGAFSDSIDVASNYADPSIPLLATVPPSILTTRQDINGTHTPDKLILRGDATVATRDQQAYAMVSVGYGEAHSHMDFGCLCAYGFGGNVLLHELGYDAGSKVFKNMALVRPAALDFLNYGNLTQYDPTFTPNGTLLDKVYSSGTALYSIMGGNDGLYVRNASVLEFPNISWGRTCVDLLLDSAYGSAYGGKYLVSTRQVAMVKDTGTIVVFDTFEAKQAVSAVNLGPVWHVQNVVASAANRFLCRDDAATIIEPNSSTPTTIASGTSPRPMVLSMTGPAGATYNDLHWRFTNLNGHLEVTSREHLYAAYGCNLAAGQRISFLTVLAPQAPGTAALPVDQTNAAVGPDTANVTVNGYNFSFKTATDSGGPQQCVFSSGATGVLDDGSGNTAVGTTPPVLAPIGNKTVLAGNPLTFTVSATAAVPTQTLTYSLDAGAPTGATIDPSTGVFSWATSGTQSAGAYPVTIRVTNNATPAASASVTITITVTSGSLAPWLTQDIGAVGLSGSAAYVSGTFQVAGAGADIYSTADAFRYVYQLANGDCSITARVTGISNTNSWAKAGVMIRNTLDANSTNAMMCVSYSNGTEWQYRPATGSSSYSVIGSSSDQAPYWVRVTRAGNVFTGYRSADGVTWTQVGASQTITMGTAVYIGLAVTSHNASLLNTSTFTNISTDNAFAKPVITPPSNMTVEAGSSNGTVVNFSISATDWAGNPCNVSSIPASGSTFPLGTTTVTVTASDAAGNNASQTFTVTVDTTPPVITVPSNMTVEATGSSGAVVTFATSATDTVSGACATVATPASGSTFPLGTTTVIVTASDAAGNNASQTFTVTVRDTTAPVISVPSNMTVRATGTGGAVVTFTTSATDAVSGTCPTVATPASGTTFPIGTTTVTVTASDAAGNTASQTFPVTVTSLNVWTGASSTAWETLGNWSAAVPTSSDVAVFAGSLTTNQPSITGSNSVAGMLFESPGWTLNSASSGTLTIGANGVVVDADSGTITLNKTVAILAGTTRFWKGRTGSTLVLTTVPGVPTGTTNLQWGDAADPAYQGTLKLTFTGIGPNIPFIVSGGILEAHKTGWINNRDLTVNGGTFLVTNSDGDLIRGGVTLNSGLVNWGGFNEGLPSLALNGGTLRGSNSTLSIEDTSPAKITVTGDVTLGDAADVSKLKLARSGSTGICDLNGGTHTFMVNSPVEFALPVTNGNLIKQGAGTLILSSTATLSGETAISGGTLEVDGTLNLSAILETEGAVTVNSGATLSGTGTINGPVTVGGNLTPGVSGTGTLCVANSLTFSADSITTVSLRRTGIPNCTGITGATSVALNGTLTVVSTSGTLAAGDTFVLFNASAYSGSFSAINLPTLDAGLFWNTGNLAVNGSIFVTNIPPLVITVSSNITVEAAGPAGSIVSFSTSALDAVDGAVATVNNPASGSTFPLGTTTVTVTATSAAGNAASKTFTVTVRDTTPPAITVPSSMTVEASGSSGALVTFATFATDTVSGARPTVATPASGSTFPLGTAMVTVTASDAAGNAASQTFTVTVRDTTPPAITVPSSMTVEASGSSGALVTFATSATDTVSGARPTVATPASGSTFPLGTTTVTVTAGDAAGNAASQTFTVTVRDTTPPAITVPSSITVEASGSSGAVVTFATSATDTVSGARATVATPASGSTFPLGTTTVTVTASDAAGNAASRTFTVTVQNTPAPGNFSAGPLNGSAWLFWNGVTGANSYTVKRSTVNGGPYTAIATGVTSTAYTDTGLTNGTTYYYVVSAVTKGGETVNSVQASATPSASASNFTNSNAGAWSTAAWLPNPPGKPISDSATSLLFNNNSAIPSTNDMGAFSLNSLTLGGQGVSLTGDPLILSGTAPVVSSSLNVAHSIGNAITLGQDTTFAINSSIVTLSGVISGTHSLTKTGSGALRLAAANSYSGDTILSGGTLAYLVNNSVPSLSFGVTGGDANVSALDLSLASFTANNLTVQTNSSGTNAITIGSGKTLTVNGGFGMDTAISGTANLAVSGAGAMAINGPASTFMVGVTSDSNIRAYSLDMSGLSGGFTANVANFYVGRTVNTYNYTPNATVKLAPNSSITAANFEIGSDAPTGNGGVNTAAQSVTVTLASGTNYLKATSATVGRIKGGVQTLNFAPGGGTVILSGTDGATALGTMYIGYKPHTGSSMDVKGVADFSNGIVTGSIGSLYVGHMTTSQGSGSPKVSGTLTLGASSGNNLVVTALNIGTFTGSTIPTSSKYPGGTVTINGGILTAGSVVMTSEQYGRANLNINGGAVTINGDITASTSIYTAITLNGGTLDMTGGAIGSATNAIATLNFQSGTLMNVAQINNGAGLTKSSTGTLTLAGINTYTGATVVSSGTLQLAGSLGLGGPVSVNAGGVLIGSGTLGSPVTVSGQIAPGVSGVGALRVNNTLTLNVGSSTSMTIDRRSGVASTQITGVSTLTYSGTLTVTSLGGTLAGGDTFILFGASAYSGSFSAISLPTLDAGLAWNTSNLAVNGSISVKDIAPPVITVPSNITVEAAGAAGSIVAFNTSALDAVDGAVATVNSPVTGSTFPLGTTTVTVTAIDAAGNAAGKTFTVTVTRSFAWFQGAYGFSGANPAADTGHGMPYLTAYAFGMNPNAPNRSLLPSAICQNGFLQISYLRYTDASDLTYVVEVSGDLRQWDSGPGYTQQVSVMPIDASRQQVVERDLVPIQNAGLRFIRVRVVK